MNHFRKKIEPIQEWNGESLDFDPDSSPEAWSHFEKYYSDEFWMDKYNFEELHFFEFTKCGNPYVDIPLSCYNRLNALNKNNDSKIDENGFNYYSVTLRVAGETDFNFHGENYNKLSKILFNAYQRDKDILYENLEKLTDCKKMHHTLLNFSLMQSMGNMQGFKKNGIHNERLDRLDTFAYKLSEYYELEIDDRSNSDIIKNASNRNKEYLQEYLDDFDGIYDYCKKVYFINDKAFVNEIIINGRKKIVSAKDVVDYMDLAQEFWKRKEEYFKNINK